MSLKKNQYKPKRITVKRCRRVLDRIPDEFTTDDIQRAVKGLSRKSTHDYTAAFRIYRFAEVIEESTNRKPAKYRKLV